MQPSNEQHTDFTGNAAAAQAVVQAVNDHYDAIIARNLDGILGKYLDSPDTYVFVEGPRYSTLGFEKIRKGWTDFCASAIRLASIEWVEGPFADAHDTMGSVNGMVKLEVDIAGRPLSNVFRASFVLLKTDGSWKIKYEHVSAPHPDPYGIGDWLNTQTA